MTRRPTARWPLGIVLFTVGALAVLWGPPPAFAPETALVTSGAVWHYLDDGSDPGTAWRAPGFADGAWPAGPALLGYGRGDEATVVRSGPDPSNKYITTYFRHAFSVADPGLYQALTLRLLRDDGAVVYLNGTEVLRSNMPAVMGDVMGDVGSKTT